MHSKPSPTAQAPQASGTVPRASRRGVQRRAFDALPTKQQKQARKILKRVRTVSRSESPLRETLSQLGLDVYPTSADTAVVTRNRNLSVTNVSSNVTLLSVPTGETKTGVYEKHKALFDHIVNEHVVDILHHYKVNCVLDVGANKGQYARKLRKAGYTGHIISFEPVPETFEQLQRNAAKDPKWHVQHCALGDSDSTMPMHVVTGTMSSLLPASDYGEGRYKRFRNESSVDVPVRRLENLLGEILPAGIGTPRVYLKLDTQGYDVEAFAGLGERVSNVVAMQSEVALLQIYEGMPRMPEALATYESKGFEITGMFPVTREKPTGRVLEFDCVMARADTLG